MAASAVGTSDISNIIIVTIAIALSVPAICRSMIHLSAAQSPPPESGNNLVVNCKLS
jgi:hypothetical protein